VPCLFCDGRDAPHEGAANADDVYVHAGILVEQRLYLRHMKQEIAAQAAIFVADHGLDYGSAKKKAFAMLAGPGQRNSNMPENYLIDDALLEHLTLFDVGHEQRVMRMRKVALTMMLLIERFNPMLTGSVWKGIVAEHVPIHIQVFCENSKEVEFTLLNHQIDFEASELAHFKTGKPIEALTMHWRNEPILISLYNEDDLRGAVKEKIAGGRLMGTPVRAGVQAVQTLVDGSSSTLA
jgi:hypothetical protein